MPHFFHFVSNKKVNGKMFMIPQKFVRKYGETLSDFMYVELSCGHQWKIKLLKIEGQIWLKNWSKFFEFYSLDQGHMIIFRYEGDSRFGVSIRDTVEIDYPSVQFSKLDNEKEEQVLKRKTVNDDSESRRKKTRTIYTDEPQSDESGKSTKVGSGTNRVNNNERTTSLERSKAFTSNLPFFVKVMKPYCLSRYNLHIDISFARENLRGKSGEAILKLPNEKKTWPVKFYWYHHGMKTTAALFNRGWNEFARSNNLKVGDVCVFVLLRTKKVSFKVVIFRDNKQSGEHERSVAEEELEERSGTESESYVSERKIKTITAKSDVSNSTKLKAKGRGKTLSDIEKNRILEKIHFESEKPFYKIVMQPSYVYPDGSNVTVPPGFARKYITNRDITLQTPNSETRWSIQFNNSTVSPKLYRGWDLFAENNNLEVGDTCVFELVDRTKALFHVHIFRYSDHDTDSYLPRGQSKSRVSDGDSSAEIMKTSIPRSRSLKNTKVKNWLLERAHFESERPFFKLVMHPSYHNGHYIRIPSEFFHHHHLENRDRDIFLWVPNATTVWAARFVTVHRKSGEVYGKIGYGWKGFAKYNNLKVGDVGIFELLNNNKLAFQVTIVRAPSTW